MFNKSRRGFLKKEEVIICIITIFLISTTVWGNIKAENEDKKTQTVEEEENVPLLQVEPIDRNIVQMALEPENPLVVECTTEETTEPETTTEVATEEVTEEPTTEMSIEDIRDFYYSFDTYTDMSINLGVSKQQFVEILNALPYDYANVFKDNAEFLWETAKKYDFNEFLMVGIMANESYWGADPIAPNNYSSQRISGDNYYTYDTAEEGIEALASNLANNYLTEGGKYYSGKSLHGIGIIYCEGNTWADAVCTCMNMTFREYFKAIQ